MRPAYSLEGIIKKLRSYREGRDFDPSDVMEEAAGRLFYVNNALEILISQADALRHNQDRLLSNPTQNAAVVGILHELREIRNVVSGTR